MDTSYQIDSRMVTFTVQLAPADAAVAPGGPSLLIPYPAGFGPTNLQIGSSKFYVGPANPYPMTGGVPLGTVVTVALQANGVQISNFTDLTWDSRTPLYFTLPRVIVTTGDRLAALEAGAPYVFGPSRIAVNAVDNATEIARYTVEKQTAGRSYLFSLVTPSVANALAISAQGVLSTVQAGFDGVAAEGAITATVRATDNQGATFDLPVTVVRRVISAGASGPFASQYLSSVEITASNSAYNFAGIVPAGATEVLIECVGGGASGFSGRCDSTNAIYVPGHGGAAGGVKQRRVRVVDVPNSVNVTIGAGGARTQTNANNSTSNAGGTTSFGALVQALGGLGGTHFTLTDLPYPWQLLPPSDLALGRQGVSNQVGGQGTVGVPSTPVGYGGTAEPSMGPGSGGSGQNQTVYGAGNGGFAGCGRADTTVRGGYFDTGGQVPRDGFDAPNVFGYGSGGCGAGKYSSSLASGGRGMFPGGGGGGGVGVPLTDTGVNTTSGNGGNGAVRLHFFKVA